MNMNLLALYISLCFINVVLQTVKSLCTIRCSTFISACVNAIAYGLYTYVIVFTNAEGLTLFTKALICASTNFVGVYLANWLFKKIFSRPVKWKIEVSIPDIDAPRFIEDLAVNQLEYYVCGAYEDWTAYAVFCATQKDSNNLRNILPSSAKYNIVECNKTL